MSDKPTRGRPPGSKDLWPDREIDQVKREVKSDLDRYSDPKERSGRLKLALQRIGEFGGDLESRNQLTCYVYIVSALVHHERWGGLQDRQIKKLTEHATGILRVQGIKLSSRRLATLYGDLHLVLSQIARKDGQTWTAVWQQQMASRLTRSHSGRSSEYLNLGAAIRALRMGNATSARRHYQMALDSTDCQSKNYLKAVLGLGKTLRLMGRYPIAESCLSRLDPLALPEDVQLELDWERLCIKTQKEGSAEALIKSIRRDMPHYQGIYILEGFLWARASASQNLTDWLVAFSTYKRKKSLRLPYLGVLYEFVGVLEDCYDASIDFYLRLDRLGHILGRLESLLSVEQHMLALVAAARFLARSNAFELASICLGEYEAMSYRVSCLKSGDILGVGGDMLQKHWFSGITGAAEDDEAS